MQSTISGLVIGACGAVAVLLAMPRCASADERTEFFEQKIRPVLVDRCYSCHSANAAAKKSLKGGLRLDTREAIRKGGDSGPAIIPGKPEDSLLIVALRHASIKMPPKGKLSEQVVSDFVKWVKIGAPDPRNGRAAIGSAIDLQAARKLWLYQPPKMPQRPKVAYSQWPRGAIDQFVLATLEANDLHPAAPADKRTLIRRAAYDLIGRPPTEDEIKAFLADTSEFAFARVVDRMLMSPDFGIRWARHWLDNVRYSQDDPTCAANDNGKFSIGPYRDWVVKSLNEDLPYDQFVRLQIAGDLIPLDSPDRINTDGYTATGLWGLAHLVEGNDKEKVVADFVDEQLDVLGRTFLGLTISCSRCHDHKFDPIKQADYYALAGIFYSSHIFTFKGKSARVRSRVQLRAVRSTLEKREIEPDEKRLEKLIAQIAKIEKKHENALELMQVRNDLQAQMLLAPKTDGQKSDIASRLRILRRKESDLLADQKKKGWEINPPALKQHAGLVVTRDSLEKNLSRFPLRMVMREGPVPATRHKQLGDMRLFIRGDHLSLGPSVPRGIPQVLELKGEKLRITGSGRLQLANWLTRKDHPLTARVMANRVWQHLLGRGIVATPSNFGKLGQRPTHPELLDYLAVRLVESDWSIKSLIREITASSVYQQASNATPGNVARDPDNRWFGRMNRKRLDAEALMDTLAWHSNRWKLGRSGRRLFGEFRRDKPQTVLELFDGANPDLLVPRRTDSTSAPQALFMLNNETVLNTAASLAKKAMARSDDDHQRFHSLFLRLFGRLATDEEGSFAARVVRRSRETRQQLVAAGDEHIDVEAGAWEDLCMALICSNEFLYIE